MATIKKVTASCSEIKQGNQKFLLTSLPVEAVVAVSYAAVRGKSSEEGAIQRVLNTSRISSICEFALQGGDFPNAVVLNWVGSSNKLSTTKNSLSFSYTERSAQIIDGQHRIYGLKEAARQDKKIGKMHIPVVIYRELTSQQCADIFLSINTEQKPVPRSLVFDLYGIASEDLVDPAALRARDIAMYLHETESSPYYDEIKLPGTPTRRGGIALSTAVAAIKPLVESRGAFEAIEIDELEMQRKIIVNLFQALKSKYDLEWGAKSNAFMYAAGFQGAIDFLSLKLIPYCNTIGSFETKTIAASLAINKGSLILQEEIKGKGGKEAAKEVYERLVKLFKMPKTQTKSIKI